MNPEIKNLIFDIGGVVITSEKVNYAEFDKKWSLKKGTTAKVLRDCFDKMSVHKNLDLKKYFLENFSHILSFNQYKEATNTFFRTEKLNQPLIDWIREKRKDYKIYALSNSTAILDILLKERFKIYNDFDRVFNSAEIGFSKPDSRIFIYMLKEINTNSNKCLFIDDNYDNVKAAKKLGFHTVLY